MAHYGRESVRECVWSWSRGAGPDYPLPAIVGCSGTNEKQVKWHFNPDSPATPADAPS